MQLLPTIELERTDLPCLVHDPDVFFSETPEGVEFAKALCGGCPARAMCLAGALERREACGVWGGELFVGGVIVARKRPRGRPRKSDNRTSDSHTSDSDLSDNEVAA